MLPLSLPSCYLFTNNCVNYSSYDMFLDPIISQLQPWIPTFLSMSLSCAASRTDHRHSGCAHLSRIEDNEAVIPQSGFATQTPCVFSSYIILLVSVNLVAPQVLQVFPTLYLCLAITSNNCLC